MLYFVRHFLARIGDFHRSESGVTSIEYGILAAGLAVIIGALVADGGAFSETLSRIFENILDQLPQSSSGSGGTGK
jgi:pilus assembly protein Flp/PilA